ncbi:Galactoside O-acetyltransferase [Caulifigura coniformis]|uniref:Galactoside O-acetyltransferase n=1 Tax=Caulifigura coniformis TaxID=2527983 RepID=A0A517SI88_9PLAN|nr:WcaF family extracellular polysaccharide biosynthesis acetyltransferase [Caulifigura coniformis]QDT55839.1 Galactoside O-acetyltransferase [Caulifigura coniformis]
MSAPHRDAHPESFLRLGTYEKGSYTPGAGLPRRVLWYLVNEFIFHSGYFPLSSLKRVLLRQFGASIGKRVVIKPHVNIKFPWRLSIGDYCWIGEEVWIDNLDAVTIGPNSCVSQGAYLCTGSHDPRQRSFPLITRPIVIGNGAWIGAHAVVLGGVTVEDNAVVGAGAIVNKNVPGNHLVVGSPVRDLGDVRPAGP